MTLNRDNNKVTILSSFIVQLKTGWFHGAEVERWSLTGELSLSCARPTADGLPLMWVNRPL